METEGVKYSSSSLIGKANAVINISVTDNKTVFGCPQVEKDSTKKNITIASPEFEAEFLKMYSQYKGML